jgi:serine/threonine-protein kinase PknK
MEEDGAPSRLAEWRYQLDRLAGQGATSEVWAAADRVSHQTVALKVARSQGDAAILADEAQSLSLAASPRIPRIVGVGRVPPGVPHLVAGAAYLATEWVDGERLERAGKAAEGDFVRLAMAVARDIGEALSHLHQAGVAHGDLKPQNVIVQRRGQAWHATLIDLGFAMAASGDGIRGATPRYLPPEAATGRSRPWMRDVYALGVMLAELVSADVANAADPSEALRHAVLPRPFDRWCAALTAPEPSARPSAAWIAACAAETCGQQASLPGAQARRVRASYLRLRGEDLRRAGRASVVDVRGSVAPWLHEAVAMARQCAALRGEESTGPAVVLEELSGPDRSRWLVALVGAAAADWVLEPALLAMPEARFAATLERLAQRVAPSIWSPRLLASAGAESEIGAAGESPAEADDDLTLALSLSARVVHDRTLALAERRAHAGDLPPVLARLLARQLALRGEVGRAASVLAGATDAETLADRAELARRGGDRASARALAEAAIRQGGPATSRAIGVLVRLLVDEGRAREAVETASASTGPSVEEARALAHLALGEREAALRAVAAGLASASDDEARARLQCVGGMEAHARGDAEAARDWFAKASEHATRAGALVEEATYRTGLAAAAVDAGFVGEALTAASRAVLLWEYLDRPTQAAYALLAQGAAFALVGANLDARRAGERARDRARSGHDERAEAFAWMLLADVSGDGTRELREAATEAWRTLGRRALPDDEVRAGARMLRASGLSDDQVAAYDALAREPGRGNTAACDWWAARASAALAGRTVGRDADIVASALRVVRMPAPVGAKGPAVHAARLLAMRSGDGDAVRLLTAAQAQLASRLIEQAPDQLREHVTSVAWVTALEGWREPGVTGQQARNLESLIRALAARDSLRALLTQVLDALVLWTGVERGLLLLTAPGGQLVVKAARNLARSDLAQAQMELSQTLARRALSTREPVVAVDASGEMSEAHASVHALGLRSVLAVPLIARGEALGVAYLDDRVRRGAFGVEELAWVKLMASVAAVAIADARDQILLRREVRRSRRAQERLSRVLAEREAELDRAKRELEQTRVSGGQRYRYDAIVGRSDPMRAMLDLLDRVTPTMVPVLIQGESGSGKELVARALHQNGPRSQGPFVTENCSAIPETLLESALFGHVRGAFTGADRNRVGLFEAADGGTLFLDEIGDMPMTMQSKLLRVLQDGEVHPVGSTRSRRVDVRVIAATNADLAAAVRAGRFREDLWFRLNVVSVRVPPLRERRDDIPLLVAHMLEVHGAGRHVRVSTGAMDKLVAYDWPGNVRQLENEVRRALVLCDDVIRAEHLTAEVRGLARSGKEMATGLDVRSRVDALERELVREALERTRGNQTKAAQLLGLSRFGLQKMMKRLEIEGR